MNSFVIAVDQSTSATKALLFSQNGTLINNVNIPHCQYYPNEGWVEHDPLEIYYNTVKAITEVISVNKGKDCRYTLALTNQRETVVVWNRNTGKPVCNAVVWQCLRGKNICDDLRAKGYSEMVRQKSGLLIDPYFSGSGVKWILDHIVGAREAAQQGELCMGTIDSWLIFNLTGGKVHATDFTNASRTLLFNIHTLDWDDDLLNMLTIPRSMMAKLLPCDSVFGYTTVENLFNEPITIAGVLGDSHGALAGQMCFEGGLGKATYGTGSSVMVNIGEKATDAPAGLVTSIGFAALDKVFYAYEGNIHCTGATIAWLKNELNLINDPGEIEGIATSVKDNGGVYFIPAFAGLAAPYWHPEVKAQVSGLTLGSTKAHVCRAALESIAFQVTDLITAMTKTAGINLKEIRVDGGPTKNQFLMRFQADLLRVPIVRSEVEDACAYGAFLMNGFALKKWTRFEQAATHCNTKQVYMPSENAPENDKYYSEWSSAVNHLISCK